MCPTFKKRLVRLLLTALIFAVGSAVQAEEGDSDSWQFSVTPYAWGLALSGDVTVGSHVVDLDISSATS